MTSWPEVLGTAVGGADLEPTQARWAMEQVLGGQATPAQIAAFATALRAKGESADEVAALAEVMLEHARRVNATAAPLLDVVGTGGDQLHTVNISTMSALVAAAAGAAVVKHGNRAASSSTGTADVLEAFGIVIDLEPAEVAACVEAVGIGFCFAPVFHPAMRHAGPTRRELGIPTVFNILGPLTNPAGAHAALIGCSAPAWAPIMAEVLARRGVHALVVRGEDGLDEISTCAPTRVWDARGREVRETTIDAADLGIARASIEDLRGGDSARNLDLLRKALGHCDPADPDAGRVSAIREAVALNAAGALVAHAAATDPGAAAQPLAAALAGELDRTRSIVSSGAALALLDRWADACRAVVDGRQPTSG